MEKLKFWGNKEADVAMIGSAISVAVAIVISILIVYSIINSTNPWSLDSADGFPHRSPAQNATNNTVTHLGTFYTLAPLILVVIAAVVILSYVTSIGARRE